jgi:hypothetical protein
MYVYSYSLSERPGAMTVPGGKPGSGNRPSLSYKAELLWGLFFLGGGQATTNSRVRRWTTGSGVKTPSSIKYWRT